MLKRLTPSELDIKFILDNYSRCLDASSLSLLSFLGNKSLTNSLSLLAGEFFTYKVNNKAKVLQDLDLEISLKEHESFNNEQQLIEILKYKRENEQAQLDQTYIRNYFLAKWLVFDNLEVKLGDFISGKAPILAVQQNSSLHHVQASFFKHMLNQASKTAFAHQAFSPEEVWQYKNNLARIEVNSLSTTKDKSKVTLNIARERIEANIFSSIELTDFSRGAIFGSYDAQDPDSKYTPGILAHPNSVIIVQAQKLFNDVELAHELISAIVNQEFNLTQAEQIDLMHKSRSISVETNTKLIILFNSAEQELINSILDDYDPYQILGAYSYHYSETSFLTQAGQINRQAYLQAFLAQTKSIVESSKENKFPDYLYKDKKKQELDEQSTYLHTDLDQETLDEIAYNLTFALPPEKETEQVSNTASYPNYSPTELIAQQVKNARLQKDKVAQKLEQATSIDSQSLVEEGKHPLEHLEKVRQDFLKQQAKLTDNSYQYLVLLCRLVSLQHLFALSGTLSLQYLNNLLYQLLRLNETLDKVYWSVDRLHYLMLRAGNSEQKLEQVLQSLDASQDTQYQMFLNYVLDGYQRIDTQGFKVGTANGLAYAEASEYSKDPQGLVFRLSCLAQSDAGSTFDVDAEIQLAGGLARRANIISTSYLKSLFEDSLEFAATIVTEQLYEPTDGDSATVCSFIALASALGKIPVNQAFAVTGSMDQFGQLQAIGGVNQKIEAFYDICKKRGFTREQGVIIPEINCKNLVLRDDVLADIAAGNFSIFSAQHISQVFELMTNTPFALADDKTTLNQENEKYQQAYFQVEQSNTSLISAIHQHINGEDKDQKSWLKNLFSFFLPKQN
ncbi:hypothetical protein CJP74_05190 [Psittacicella melopsittaci]|uniref:Lon proteolytic domain-containing protein n=1 Tax=Psittacicella melopsittaci TaxID=2028576 RepID=A0A3A1Y1Q2_9GAMM|nr:S16 family serine protease [Psittacicella melopsittaci]RIY32163.1 hypothetical protein CJP74_05190 [Psittacicella melopsittaci]